MGLFGELWNPNDDVAWAGGVVTGTVKENGSKDFPGHVKVEVILGEQSKNITGWVPVASSYAGDGYGCYALPEIGSEVVLAFNMGDRNCPIVIGTLWNKKNKLPEGTANEKNTVKSFTTKGGCKVVFNDEGKKAKIEVTTPEKLTISIDDEKKIIEIRDETGDNGVSIDGEKGEMKLKAKSKIELLVGGKAMITLDGNSKAAKLTSDNIQIEATQGLKLKGQNTSVEGAMVNLKAQSTMKAEASGMTEIKGAMVKIN